MKDVENWADPWMMGLESPLKQWRIYPLAILAMAPFGNIFIAWPPFVWALVASKNLAPPYEILNTPPHIRMIGLELYSQPTDMEDEAGNSHLTQEEWGWKFTFDPRRMGLEIYFWPNENGAGNFSYS